MNENNVVSHTEVSRPLPEIDLERMSDEALKKLITDSYKLLDKRRREHEKKIKEQIKQLAIDAGIKVSFREPIERKKKDS